MKARKNDAFLLTILSLLLLTGAGLTVLCPAPQFSEKENRYLADVPTFTGEALLSGAYTKSLDGYFAEHIPTKDAMREARAVCELAMGKALVNDILLCPNGRLVRCTRENGPAQAKNLRALDKVGALCAAEGLACTACVLPDQEALASLLPNGYPPKASAAEEALLKRLDNPDYWYRTDHHMTTAGAYALYAMLGEALDYKPYGAEDFTPVTVSNHFWGTSDAAAGIPQIAPDEITLYRYAGDEAAVVGRAGEILPLVGFYDMKKLTTRDGYGVFLGGNHALLEISQGSEDTRPTLLVIKDSYANALLPFLARHYRLLVIDPRYGAPAASTLIARADRVLVLCGESTLSGNFLSAIAI